MRERDITELVVRLAILQPTKVEQDKTHPKRFVVKKIASLPKKEYLLLVIYEEVSANTINVITVISTSKINKYL